MAVGAGSGTPVIHDLGSGLLMDSTALGLPHEPTPADSVAAGVDLVAFSGDKLLGGPQAGWLVGRGAAVAAAKAHPLCRALRCDKVTLAGLEATLALYRDPDRARERIPALRMIGAGPEELRRRAEAVLAAVGGGAEAGLGAEIADGWSLVGGGTFPGCAPAQRGDPPGRGRGRGRVAGGVARPRPPGRRAEPQGAGRHRSAYGRTARGRDRRGGAPVDSGDDLPGRVASRARSSRRARWSPGGVRGPGRDDHRGPALHRGPRRSRPDPRVPPKRSSRLRALGFALVIVTNQSGIGRGLYTLADYRRVAAETDRQLARAGVAADATYFCTDAPGGDPETTCRKPSPVLYRQAARDLGLVLAGSYFVGDKLSDVLPAAELGGTGILVRTGHGAAEEARVIDGGVPEASFHVTDDLAGAAQLIERLES